MTHRYLTLGEILRLQGHSEEQIAQMEREYARTNSWIGKLGLWWRRTFPPKSWRFTCASCGKRTADPGDRHYGLPSYCSRRRCRDASLAHLDRLLAAKGAS